ncbi:hypothetical protein ElyMa_000534600 [Elysia marginata]|uniref:Uncharacterized protein n=1 Tax=Elysia marginata TaxID=1093978 RepID=A0AAV4G0D9_9GAST|nr:hypothetical protein ElyMa_000534600 [Elysia marginata]
MKKKKKKKEEEKKKKQGLVFRQAQSLESQSQTPSLWHMRLGLCFSISTEDTPLPPPAAPSCPSTSTVQVKVRLPGPVGQQRKEENRRNCILRLDISPLRHYGKHMVVVLTAPTTISNEKVKTADILIP